MNQLYWQIYILANLFEFVIAFNSTNKTNLADEQGFYSPFPIGTVMIYAADEVPPLPWLLCDGSEISRSLFQNLFNAIDTKYGAGDGINTFNLPDFRGRVVIGVDHAELHMKKAQTVGLSGGKANQTLTVSQIPTHSHGKGTLGVSDSGAHKHEIYDPGHNHGGSTGSGPSGRGSWALFGWNGVGSDRAYHSHTINTWHTGISIYSGGSHGHNIIG